jgi:tetratricopeptide (TPR) repeat protein
MDRGQPWAATAASVLLVCLGPLAGSSTAQPSTAAKPQAQELVRQAYGKTSTAKTLVEFTEIIELCTQAQQGELSTEMQEYVKKLQAWAHNRRGEAYTKEAEGSSQSGQTERGAKLDQMALTEFDTAVQLRPDYWKALHNRGVGYGLARKFDEAIQDFTRVIELQPTYGDAWFNRAEIHYEHGRYAEALADYRAVLRLKPDDLDALMRRGHAHFQLQQFPEALADYNRAVELSPNNAEALANRGDAQRNLKQFAKAEADYRAAMRLNAKSARAHQSAAWLMATCPESRYRNPALAVQYAEKACELVGTPDFQYLDTLAAAHANAGDFEKARQRLAQAIRIAPASQTAPLQTRLSLYQQKKPFRE